MAKSSKTTEHVTETFAIQQLTAGTARVHLLGTSAMLMNRMAAKAKQQLLWPKPTENRAARQARIKHDPNGEFRDSMYRCRDDHAPTLVHIPSGAIKKAMAQAAIDTPGATKAEIGRLVRVLDPTIHLYGIPYLHMSVVRQAGIAKTPDIRTRAFFPQWACSLEIRYIKDRIREVDMVNLITNAGMICGIGDGRTEKGTFDFGAWTLVDKDNPAFTEIVKNQGRKAQLAAWTDPVCADEDTEELYGWYNQELVRREKRPESAPAAAKAKKGDGKPITIEQGVQ